MVYGRRPEVRGRHHEGEHCEDDHAMRVRYELTRNDDGGNKAESVSGSWHVNLARVKISVLY